MGTNMDEAIQNEKKYTIAAARHVHSFTIETQPRAFKGITVPSILHYVLWTWDQVFYVKTSIQSLFSHRKTT